VVVVHPPTHQCQQVEQPDVAGMPIDSTGSSGVLVSPVEVADDNGLDKR